MKSYYFDLWTGWVQNSFIYSIIYLNTFLKLNPPGDLIWLHLKAFTAHFKSNWMIMKIKRKEMVKFSWPFLFKDWKNSIQHCLEPTCIVQNPTLKTSLLWNVQYTYVYNAKNIPSYASRFFTGTKTRVFVKI